MMCLGRRILTLWPAFIHCPMPTWLTRFFLVLYFIVNFSALIPPVWCREGYSAIKNKNWMCALSFFLLIVTFVKWANGSIGGFKEGARGHGHGIRLTQDQDRLRVNVEFTSLWQLLLAISYLYKFCEVTFFLNFCHDLSALIAIVWCQGGRLFSR